MATRKLDRKAILQLCDSIGDGDFVPVISSLTALRGLDAAVLAMQIQSLVLELHQGVAKRLLKALSAAKKPHAIPRPTKKSAVLLSGARSGGLRIGYELASGGDRGGAATFLVRVAVAN